MALFAETSIGVMGLSRVMVKKLAGLVGISVRTGKDTRASRSPPRAIGEAKQGPVRRSSRGPRVPTGSPALEL